MSVAPLESFPLPRREPWRAPASPDEETERLVDWGLLTAALAGLTADDLEVCRGVLLRHADGRLECVEGALCPADPAFHEGTEPCVDLVGGCCG